jgi:hypothetical protein
MLLFFFIIEILSSKYKFFSEKKPAPLYFWGAGKSLTLFLFLLKRIINLRYNRHLYIRL